MSVISNGHQSESLSEREESELRKQEGLTNSDNTRGCSYPKGDRARQLTAWGVTPLDQLLEGRVGREPDGGVGTLSQHLHHVSPTQRVPLEGTVIP